MKSRLINFTILILVSLLFSCAYGNREVQLRNTIPKPRSVTEKNFNIAFTEFNDLRTDTAVGYVQNTYGVKTAKVVSKTDVKNWINKEIHTQLRNEGFKTSVNGLDSNEVLTLNGDIVKVYAAAYFNYVGEVNIQAIISLNNKVISSKEYIGYVDEKQNLSASSEGYRDALEKALYIASRKIADDLVEIDKNFKNGTTLSEHVNQASTNDSLKNKPLIITTEQDVINIKNVPSAQVACPLKHGDVVVIDGSRQAKYLKMGLNKINRELFEFYKSRLDLDPNVEGTINIMLEIQPDGEVTAINTITNETNDKVLEDRMGLYLMSMNLGSIHPTRDITHAVYRYDFSIRKAQKSKKCCYTAILGIAVLNLLIQTLF